MTLCWMQPLFVGLQNSSNSFYPIIFFETIGASLWHFACMTQPCMLERWANIDVFLFTDEPILFLGFRYIFASISVCSVRLGAGFLIDLFSVKTQTAWKTESALWTLSNFFIEPTLPGYFSEMTKITKSWRGKKLLDLNLLHDSIYSKHCSRRSCH